MKIFTRLILTFCAVICNVNWSNVDAQVSAYSFAVSTETYAQITGTTSTATGDDGTQAGIAIGFTFTFGGVDYTQFGITTNGMLRLGTDATTTEIASGWTNSLGNSAVLKPLIAPFWDDNNLNTGTIRYSITGTSPNQVLTVNWHNTKIGSTGGTGGASVSTILRLYQTTNVIEMVYSSPFTTTNTVSASVGINDVTSFLSVTPASTPTVSSTTANNGITASVMANLAGKKLTFTPPVPCTTPSAQPSGLTFSSVAATSLTGNFTAASPAPSGYLVVRSTSSTLSSNPVDGTTYTAGNVLGGGTVVQASSATTFSQTGLTANTTYYYFIFAYNNTSCSGGPIYQTVDPLSSSTTTCPSVPTAVATSTITTNSFNLGWTAPTTGATDYTVEVSLTSGGTPISGFPQTVSAGPITASTLSAGTIYYYRVKANSASCSSAWVSGNITTLFGCPDNLGAGNVTVASLPYTGTGFTNNGAGNDVTATNAIICSSASYYGGEDRVFIFTPTQSLNHQIDLTTTTDDDAGIMLYNGCPFTGSGSTCVGFAQSTSGLTRTITAALTAGVTYYLLVDNFPAPNYITSYNLSITPLNPCVTPADQPTGLTFSSTTNTTLSGSFSAAASAPSGYLVVRSTSSSLSANPVDATTYTAGTALGGGTVVQVGTTTTFSQTGLTANTTYYYFVFAYNNTNCTGGPIYLTINPLSNSTTTCPNAATTLVTSSITSSSFNLAWTASSGGATDYTVEISLTNGGAAIPALTQTVSASPVSITGLSANTQYYYRVKANNSSCSTTSATNGSITTLQLPCVAPTNQPTALVLTPTSTSVAGTFTAALPVPTGYLVVRSASSTAPTPVNGTVYSAGGALGSTTVVYVGTASSFTASSLTVNTTYYFFVFAYNSTTCSGGPIYQTIDPLTSSTTTCAGVPTSVITSNVAGTSFSLGWTAPSGGATNYEVEVSLTSGGANISGFPQTVSSLSLSVSGLTAATTYYYRVRANGSCSSSWASGSIATTLDCAAAISLACATPVTSGNLATSGGIYNPPSTTCGFSTPGKELLYSFTPTMTGTHTLNITGVNGGSGYIDYFYKNISGGCGSTGWTCIGDNNVTSITTIGTLTAGTTYYILLDAESAASTANHTFQIDCPQPLPNCATLNTPATSATNVVRNTPLTWTAPATGGTPSGYKVYIGTTTNPALVTTVTAPTTSYTPSGQAYNTTYFWRIVPTNTTGDAVGCTTEYSYTTEPPPPGMTCANPSVINSYPYSGSGTTCGFGNDYGTQCSGSYGAGEDYVYQLDITTTGVYNINLTATGGGSYIGWFLKGSADCATGASCLTNAVSGSGTAANGTYNFTSAGTYYLIIDTWPSPNCSAFTLSITPPVAAPNCATLGTPADAATNVVRNTPLTWTAPASGPTPTAYKVYLGTVNPPTTLVGSPTTTTYTPTGQAYSTTYYWYVVPTNSGTDAVGCNTTVFSYTTEAPPPPPANDDPCGAISITPGTTCSFTQYTNANATSSTTTTGGAIPTPTCSTYSGGDVWFSAVIPPSGKLTFDSQSGVVTDGVMSIYASSDNTCTGLFSNVACDDDAGTGAMPVINITGQTPGNTVFIRFWEYGNDGNGTFSLCVYDPAPVPNCATLTSPANGATNVVVNSALTWTAPASGAAPTGYKVYYGTLAAPSLVTTVATTTYTPAGEAYSTTYYWRIVPTNASGDAVGCTTEFSYTTQPAPIANDECSGAININGNGGQAGQPTGVPIAATTVGATQSLANTCGGNADDDVWFTFATDEDGGDLTINVTPSGGFDPVIELYSGSCGAPTSIACIHATQLNYTGQAASTTYFIRVYDFGTGLVGDVEERSAGGFTIAIIGSALPIELTAFTGKVLDHSNLLQWTTASERNVQSHNIERSINGINNWILVGQTASKGNGETEQSYSLEDRTPLTKSYYRLRTVDTDGQEQISQVIALTRKDDRFGILSAFPNPAMESIAVQFNTNEEGTVTARITDVTGRLVMQQQMGAEKGINLLPIQLGQLSAGTYFITLQNGSNITEPMRFVKQ